MPNRMLHFTHRPKAMPDKRDADARVQDFHEIYREYITEKAAEQAGRCSQCGIPFCQVHCPLQNNIPDWLMLTANGRLQEAYDTAQATNTFPEICGRICPQDRLCEGGCVIEQSGHGTVTIGAVEKYITETAWDNGWVRPLVPGPERGETIGIIGAGPAGLAAAEQLRELGYGVTVYDRYDRVGGLLIYGIPSFKLEKDVVQRRTDRLVEGGVVFKLNFEVGRDATMAELQEKHAAVLIATGVYKARALDAPGRDLQGVHAALDYLITANKVSLGDDIAEFNSGTLDAKDKTVVVIGGGDTAMDCVRTAVRQGAKSVSCLYRRDRENMPGSARETTNAEEEGVTFKWLSVPIALDGQTQVQSMRAATMRLGAPDASGRRMPEIVEGQDMTLEADMVIEALGFEPEDLPTLFSCSELPVTRWGTVEVDPASMMTKMEGVFAAGDIVRGASLVVWAIREGRDAAHSIHKYLAEKARTAA